MSCPLNQFLTVLSTQLETPFCHSLTGTGWGGWIPCAHHASWICSLFNFLQRSTMTPEIHDQAVFCCSTFDHQCWQQRYLVILPYDGVPGRCTWWSPHVQCFLKCNSFMLTVFLGTKTAKWEHVLCQALRIWVAFQPYLCQVDLHENT